MCNVKGVPKLVKCIKLTPFSTIHVPGILVAQATSSWQCKENCGS